MRLFFSAGEASGDVFAGAILERLRPLLPDNARIEAIGGPRLRQAGADVVADSSVWGSIGIVAIAGVLARAIPGVRRGKRALSRGEPGLLVAVDSGLMNVGLCRFAKRLGWKVLYFNPPGSWRRDRQGKDLPLVTDAIVTPFSWSAEMLRSMGANVHWFGHPIKELLAAGQSKVEDPRETIAVLPGSRRAEVDALLPVLAEALVGESRTCEIAVAPNMSAPDLEARWKSLCPNRSDVFTKGDTYGVLRRARAGVICSGTATLEAALCRCPMAVVYRVSPISKVEAWVRRVDSTRISQPNILLQEDAIMELVQDDAKPDRIRDAIRELCLDSKTRQAQLAAFDRLDQMLGGDQAITATARLAAEMLGSE